MQAGALLTKSPVGPPNSSLAQYLVRLRCLPAPAVSVACWAGGVRHFLREKASMAYVELDPGSFWLNRLPDTPVLGSSKAFSK